MTPSSTPRPIPGGDDPTGGRRLTRRMVRWLPPAALIGMAAGIVLVVLGAPWSVIVLLAGAAVVMTGSVLAALEDGAVQRRIDRIGRSGG